MMAGYRRVNYYELCRLCASSEGTKMHIFREEGRRRSLPSKIQTCLPLQVQEEDSLPKIICSSCVEKLESYFEFREACINAEAMLESYFTSLKYSEDLTREGKVPVYVKDESPKKKDESTSTKVPISTVTSLNNVSTITDENTILPSAIQILTDSEGSRLTQYKLQMQGGIPALVPYGDQSTLPLSVSIPTLTQHTVKQSTSTNSSRSDDGTQTSNDPSSLPAPPPLIAAVTIAPPSQDIIHQIGIATKERNAITEVLKLKNINILEPETCESVAVSATQISSQVPTLIPAQIRLDQNQIHQLINSNLQINLSQLQPNQRESAIQSKNPNATRSAVISHGQVKSDTGTNTQEETDSKESLSVSMATLNGSNERLNSSFSSSKSSAGVNKFEKREEPLKFDGNSVEMEQRVAEDGENASDGNPQSANDEDNQCYECETCTKTFKRKEHLFQHKKSHSGERPFVCSTCTKAFSRKEHLLRHTVSHTGQKLYACDVCQKSFSRKDNLAKHKKTHGINGPYVCETCGKSFVVKHYYVLHKSQHDSFPNTENSTGVSVKHLISTNSTINPLPFKCDLCTKSFSIKSYLTSHRLRHRSKAKREREDGETQEQEQQPQQRSQGEQQEQSSPDITIPQPTILSSLSSTSGNLNLSSLNSQLSTINPSALLAPNIIHHSSANVVHIGSSSYLCTSNVTSEFLEQYRKIHSS